MELWEMGAVALAEAIRDRRASSREVLDALRARRREVNAGLNAIVADVADADHAAAAADAAVAAGRAHGALHGVPVSSKVNVDVAGEPTTSGAAALADVRATCDAPVVERLRAAGAIPFARTNMPDFGLRNHTDSSLYGRTANPWDPNRTAGGSSGGEAVAVATGMSPLGIGNDVAGSLRNPAHCCGVVGFKPSTGLVPHAASLPPRELPITYQLMLAQGFLARHVVDVRAALAVTAGAHPRDPLALPVVPPRREGASTPLRVAVTFDPPGGTSEAPVRRALERVAAELEQAGCVVSVTRPRDYDRTAEVTWDLLMSDFRVLRVGLGGLLGEEARLIADNMEVLLPARTAEQIAAQHLERNAHDLAWHAFLTDWDVLLTPCGPAPARVHGDDIASVEGTRRSLAGLAPLVPANLLGLPAVAVPVLADGLPVAAQFIGRRFADHRVLDAAQLVEDRLGTVTPIHPTAAGTSSSDQARPR